ncbi:MAG: Tetratricopeptide repeat-containing protein [Candidatus Kentron sp. G]|nr:MAG: Tetratricopeptide repeat-containing protein [Candidatus Kentron sp. G]VFN02257.1 MAG: Tetratricopeptide repeat-containing protein [Candidatus Kentron sp. G]VFN02790.1 MAG: Tetratricopeptide repeat-containing protein [Candidatus Kentron sp. G]
MHVFDGLTDEATSAAMQARLAKNPNGEKKIWRQEQRKAKMIGDKIWEAKMTSNISTVLHRQGQWSRAHQSLNNALALLDDEFADDTLVLEARKNILTNLGTCASECAQSKHRQRRVSQEHEWRKRAEGYFQDALDVSRKSGDQESVADALGNVGTVYMIREQYSEAMTYFQKALAIYQKLGNRKSMAIGFNNMGCAYIKQENFDDAKKFLGKALSLCKKEEFMDLVPKVLANLGEIAKTQGEVDTARMYWENALYFFDGFGQEAKARSIRKQLASLEAV